ncbi:MAG TPA: TRZ/ATZ family hydrolase [Casimicrobiaceae bacterium]|jgi:5-methylthioadenosine/S-adenosylhomocysteine deaminase|nr:TRZ/ATZ family hydrolase [Casimicrobiaceae bacterium]
MAPKIVDLRIDATWVVPVEPAGVLTDHALIVDGGIIVDVVATTDTVRYAPRAQVSLPHHVLIPGLVNAHTHAAMTLLRGIADDVPLRPWLTDHIWPREGRFVSADFVYDGTLIGAAEMLRGGITCCNDMYFHPDAAARAYEAAGMRALVGVPILDFPTPYAADADAYLQRGLAARDAFKHSPRLTFALAPHAPYTVGDATWRKIVMYAGQLELPIETHVAETRAEVEEARAQTGSAPLARLARLGATGPDFIAIHAVHLDAADIDLLATHGCHVVHCPASNMKLASGIAPVTALRARGINVALGTDGAASNNRLDVLGEMRLASLIAKAATGDAAALPAAEVLHMATLGGARALGLGDTTGSLVPGKQADIAAIDLSGVQALPVYDPVSHIVHVAERADVSHVWVAGAPVVADRALLALDVAALAARARAWQAKLR